MINKTGLLSVFFFITVHSLLGQFSVNGTVFDAASNLPLPNVHVSVPGTDRFTITDSNGYFEFREIHEQEIILEFSCIGYQKHRRSLRFLHLRETVIISMKETPVELKEITVTGAALLRQTDTRTSLTQITPVQTKKMPGASEDILRSLQALPGVLAANDFTSQLVIRGGGPEQNLILMDDVEIFNPYRLYGVVSMFNPEIVNETDLYTGSFPVRYGDRLSGVLDVRMRDGSQEHSMGINANMNTTNMNLVTEGKFPKGIRGSWLLTGRRTYYDLILGTLVEKLKLVSGRIEFPNFSDLQARFVLFPHSRHKLSLNGILSRDKLDVAAQEGNDKLDAEDVTKNNTAGITWSFMPETRILSRFVASYYLNGGNSDFEGSGALRNNLGKNNLLISDSNDNQNILEMYYKQSFSMRKWSFDEFLFIHKSPSGKIDWQSGAGYDLFGMNLKFDLVTNALAKTFLNYANDQGWFSFPEQFENTTGYNRIRIFSLLRWYAEENLTIEPGIRYDYYGLINQHYFSPRFNVSYSFNAITTLRFGSGLFYQSPGYEKLIDGHVFFDLQKVNLSSLRAERSVHYVCGLERWMNEKWKIKTEIYYKHFDDLIVQKYDLLADAGPVPVLVNASRINYPDGWTLVDSVRYGLTPIPVNDSRGKAYGFELFVEKRNKKQDDRLNGWFSYAYSKAHRTRNGVNIPFIYDRTHAINIVGTYSLPRNWEAGITWRYGTGFPYTPPDPAHPLYPLVLKKCFPSVSGDSCIYEIVRDPNDSTAEFLINYGSESNEFSGRYPDYIRLDIRISKFVESKKGKWEFYLDIINVMNRKNILRYEFVAVKAPYDLSQPPQVKKAISSMFPIIPTFGIHVRF